MLPQKSEARGIISNMLHSYGAQDATWNSALENFRMIHRWLYLDSESFGVEIWMCEKKSMIWYSMIWCSRYDLQICIYINMYIIYTYIYIFEICIHYQWINSFAICRSHTGGLLSMFCRWHVSWIWFMSQFEKAMNSLYFQMIDLRNLWTS